MVRKTICRIACSLRMASRRPRNQRMCQCARKESNPQPSAAPSSQPFGAIVVQASEAEGSGSANVGPPLTVREVAAWLRVCTATVYSS
jgi:hypothetical protein